MTGDGESEREANLPLPGNSDPTGGGPPPPGAESSVTPDGRGIVTGAVPEAPGPGPDPAGEDEPASRR